jgi:DNA-directed RNA polymerase subunit K/omega
MDFKKSKTPVTTITRDLSQLYGDTRNIYETIAIVAKRANQISVEIKQELNRRLEEFSGFTDNLEEVFENREQIEISRSYEKLPKPALLALQEYIDREVYYRNPITGVEIAKTKGVETTATKRIETAVTKRTETTTTKRTETATTKRIETAATKRAETAKTKRAETAKTKRTETAKTKGVETTKTRKKK